MTAARTAAELPRDLVRLLAVVHSADEPDRRRALAGVPEPWRSQLTAAGAFTAEGALSARGGELCAACVPLALSAELAGFALRQRARREIPGLRIQARSALDALHRLAR